VPWFADVGRWASAALVPLEFVRCVSPEEVAAHISSGRRFSAALVDGASHGLDRDLVATLAAAGCPTLVIGALGQGRAEALGVAAVLEAGLDPAHLRTALEQHCRPIGSVVPQTAAPGSDAPPAWRGRLVAVTGGSGSGSSITSMMLAQGLAVDDPVTDRTLLVDACLDAHHAVLHGAPDVGPGIAELADAHRTGSLDATGVARLTFTDDRRGYRLLLGLRRHRDWTALRPRAVEAAVATLLRTHAVVVADTDADLEGEGDCGSPDVEERNVLARTCVLHADLVVVTASVDLLGLHRYARVVHQLLAAGVEGTRVQPVVVRGPTGPAGRASVARTMAQLVVPLHPDAATLASPLHVPTLRRLDDVLTDARPLPARPAAALAGAVSARLDALAPARAIAADEPLPVAPGSLGMWFDDDTEAPGA
jgi:hypothetical protein